MTPLQEAAQAARDNVKQSYDVAKSAPISLPVCSNCDGDGWDGAESYRCMDCGGCGVDTSNPYEVLGRAFGWLFANHRHPAVWQTGASALALSTRIEEPHDGTPEGFAAACLRLVARCAP